MAKKTVASLQTTKKKMTKLIRFAKNDIGHYTITEKFIKAEKLDEELSYTTVTIASNIIV